ncbi:MAG: DUF1684 domain-containing protein [Bacteroidota bacterium]|nr:DUF1684 domain-containing protein [Bacteroidota bacterium]
MHSIIYTTSLFIALFTSFGLINNDQFFSDENEQNYRSEIDRWHNEQIKNLKKEHGWLSLIDLVWLKEEKNAIPLLGSITLKNEKLFVALKNNIQATSHGKPFTSGVIQPEKDKILFGSKAFVVIRRDGKYGVRIWDSESPTRKNFNGVERYPVSIKWRVEARWEVYAKPKKVEIPTIVPGIFGKGIAPGVAIFTIDGKEFRLEPTVDSAQTEYFFVFADRTNGKESYAAGRFLDADPPVNGTIVLDFNKSTNPPCAFTDFATCPVPSKENRLSVKVEAGEKKYDHR